MAEAELVMDTGTWRDWRLNEAQEWKRTLFLGPFQVRVCDFPSRRDLVLSSALSLLHFLLCLLLHRS